MSTTKTVPNRMIPGSRQVASPWKVGVAAALTTAAINGALFAAAVAAGVFPTLTIQPGMGAQMSIEPILLVSVLGTLGGIGIYELLRRRLEHPLPMFFRIAGVALLLSFVAPLAIPGITLTQVGFLNLLHLSVAGAVAWTVTRRSASGSGP